MFLVSSILRMSSVSSQSWLLARSLSASRNTLKKPSPKASSSSAHADSVLLKQALRVLASDPVIGDAEDAVLADHIHLCRLCALAILQELVNHGGVFLEHDPLRIFMMSPAIFDLTSTVLIFSTSGFFGVFFYHII
jgi:hypothetical protein